MSSDFLATQELHKQILNTNDSELLPIISALPDKKLYEFGFHKLLSNCEISYSEWKDWQEWTYPVQDLLRFKSVILDNLDVIQGQRIVDYACHIGYYSLFSLHCGAAAAIGTNIRQHCLDIAQEVITAGGYKNFTPVLANLHDYQTNTTLAKKADTALICGVMYHVHDHYNILESIAQGDVKNIIIESSQQTEVGNNTSPLIWWKSSPTDADLLGYHRGRKQILVGFPNESWFNLAMSQLGYSLLRSSRYTRLFDHTGAHTEGFARSVQTYQKINT